MIARQFGFVIARALAVQCVLYALNQGYFFYGALAYNRGGSVLDKLMPAALIGVFLLMGTFLWTTAQRFAGDVADSQPTMRAGNWIVRLVFTALGILIVLSALNPVVSAVLMLRNQYRDSGYSYTELIVSGIKFLVGIGLILAYRFDKTAALQAAQASVEPTQ